MNGKRVVGVSYDAELRAPVVVLKGAHDAADAILAAAHAHPEVRVVENAALVDELYRTPIDGPVDRALFPIMAALLAHVVAVDRSLEEDER
jgi:type III secretion system FlhB-like substrate exporter